jgi:hypothetical protein
MVPLGVVLHVYHGTRVPIGTVPVHVYVRESVGVCCPAFAPSLNWLPCILPKHTWFSVHMHMCALFQSGSCDITL